MIFNKMSTKIMKKISKKGTKKRTREAMMMMCIQIMMWKNFIRIKNDHIYVSLIKIIFNPNFFILLPLFP